MGLIQHIWVDLTDESMRLAVIIGLFSVPATVLFSGAVAEPIISGTPLLFVGLVIGYVYSNRQTRSRRAGLIAGTAGSIGTMAAQLAYIATVVFTQPLEIAVIFVLLTPLVLTIGIVLSVLIAMFGAVVGNWLGKQRARIGSVGIMNG